MGFGAGTMNKSEEVLATIKETYYKTQRPIPIPVVKGKLDIQESSLVGCLKYLEGIGKIKVQNFLIIPILTDQELLLLEKEEAKIDDEKIRLVLEKLGKATPEEIFWKYVELFGKVNPETLTRHVREMFKQNKIQREKEIYFLSESKPTTSLDSFV